MTGIIHWDLTTKNSFMQKKNQTSHCAAFYDILWQLTIIYFITFLKYAIAMIILTS